MRRALYFITAITLIATSTGRPVAQSANAPGRPAAQAKTRIGVFDSRCVAVAYYNTPEYRKDIQQMTAARDAARAANDKAKVEALEFQGPAIQNLMHYQVFSNASIPNVLEKLSGVLPAIAQDARVSLIVSKWDVAHKDASVDYVDLTDQLVRPFNPDARTLQSIAQIKAQTPMPLLEAVKTIRADR